MAKYVFFYFLFWIFFRATNFCIDVQQSYKDCKVHTVVSITVRSLVVLGHIG